MMWFLGPGELRSLTRVIQMVAGVVLGSGELRLPTEVTQMVGDILPESGDSSPATAGILRTAPAASSATAAPDELSLVR